MTARGIDYAWHGPLDWACLKASGVTFILRYFSNDPSKDLSAAELAAANGAGLGVGVVWETTANRMLGGFPDGQADAKTADARTISLGMTGVPLYFACDFDAAEVDQAAVNAYLDGAASVIGLPRTGMYGGYYPLSRAWDAEKLSYGWQTYAWSGGLWDARAQLRQVQNNVTVCGVSADWDEAHAQDWGQWPRPGSPKPPAVPPFPYPAADYIGTPRPDPHCHSGCYGGTDATHTRTWQQRMHDRGWIISVDGCYGPQSENVCRQFQAEKGLSVDGLVGPQTWGAAWTAPVT